MVVHSIRCHLNSLVRKVTKKFCKFLSVNLQKIPDVQTTSSAVKHHINTQVNQNFLMKMHERKNYKT